MPMKRALAPAGCDPYRRGFLADPWAGYRQLSEAGPVLWHEKLHLWIVTGHAEALSVLRDDSFVAGGPRAHVERLGARSGRDFSRLLHVLDALPFFRDPPAHALLRRATVAIFSGRPVPAYVPEIRALVDRLLAPARRDGGIDAVRGFADLLPPLFVASLLGLPEADLPELRRCGVVLKGLNRLLSLREYDALEQAAQAGRNYFAELIRMRRRAPGEDGISRMLAAEHQGTRLTDEEAASLCIGFYLVGVETTCTFIGSAIRTLADFPAQQNELRAQPGLLKAGIEELLRYETPVQNVVRVAGAARAVGGQAIEAGSRVVVLLAAANRDARVWTAPESLDFRRNGEAHLTFADGPHHCVGAALARVESQVALEAWLELPACRRLSAQDSWWELDWLRRLRHFPVQFQ
jgi:cytochrome P450